MGRLEEGFPGLVVSHSVDPCSHFPRTFFAAFPLGRAAGRITVPFVSVCPGDSPPRQVPYLASMVRIAMLVPNQIEVADVRDRDCNRLGSLDLGRHLRNTRCGSNGNLRMNLGF